MKRMIALFVFIVSVLGATAVFAVDLRPGQDYFLRSPLYAAKDKDDKLYWVNYSEVSDKLKAGEKVTVIELKENFIAFMLHGKKYFFFFTQKGLTGMSAIYDKYFTKEDVGKEIAKFDEKIRANIILGKVEPGMTKKQVLFAAGCPPVIDERKTYDLPLENVMSSDVWTYYRSRFDKWSVQFANGKVTSVQE